MLGTCKEYTPLANILHIVMTTQMLTEKFTKCIHSLTGCVPCSLMSSSEQVVYPHFTNEEIEAKVK